MIIKQKQASSESLNHMEAAGEKAEQQMAFYLHRAFADEPSIAVLNDVRLVDPEQPEYNDKLGACQIDHLVIHQWGAFIIESKSVSAEIRVRGDSSGGDEWERSYHGQWKGMNSPIQQAFRQAEFLRKYLQRHRESLLGKVTGAVGLLTKLTTGTDQRGFTKMPMQVIIAISGSGRIHRINNWQEPSEPFRTFLTRADLVTVKISDQITEHRSSRSLLNPTDTNYGQWQMQPQEVLRVGEFLLARHTPRVSEPSTRQSRPEIAPPVRDVASPQSTQAQCKLCNSHRLVAQWGKFGYYWKCLACDANTAMPVVCSLCKAEGERGQVVRIRKEGARYYRACERCRVEECIWNQPNAM